MTAQTQAHFNAANRLHHISMLYAGSLVELSTGKPVSVVPQNYPGLKDTRDLIDQVLYCRAEVNALTQCLVDAGLLTKERVTEIFTENYNYFASEKIKRWPGFKVEDYGLSIDTKAATAPPEQKN